MIHNKELHSKSAESPLLSEARRLAPLLAGKADENEAAGRVSDESIAAMRDAGFFSLMVPKAMGGVEATPLEVLSIVEEVCNIDVATGWVMMAANVATASAAASLTDAGYETVFGGNSQPIIAGAGAPTGKAEIVEGGYRLTGKWTYGSGCLHCDYYHAGAMIYENGAPRFVNGTKAPETRVFLIPADKVRELGNWDTLGLRATGSIDYEVTDVFVPSDMTHPSTDVVGRRGGDSYRIGVVGFSAIGHTGVALGHGRTVLDLLSGLVNSPSSGPTLSGLINSDAFLEDFAIAEGRLRAARALSYDVWSDIQDTISKGEAVPVRQFTWARLAVSHATTALKENALFAHQVSGGVGLRAGRLQRALRDSLSATQHLVVSSNSVRDAGKDFLGLAENMKWTPRGLVSAN